LRQTKSVEQKYIKIHGELWYVAWSTKQQEESQLIKVATDNGDNGCQELQRKSKMAAIIRQ